MDKAKFELIFHSFFQELIQEVNKEIVSENDYLLYMKKLIIIASSELLYLSSDNMDEALLFYKNPQNLFHDSRFHLYVALQRF